MGRTGVRTAWTGIAAAAVVLSGSGDARACGGCFAPMETEQVVTDHRMVLALHAYETILWDQIRYSGRPQDFSWVLPVQGDVTVELASGSFFDTLAAATAPSVTAPASTCPTSGGGGFLGSPASFASDRANGGVEVLHTAIVGPYETVTLRSSDANALTTWLRGNGYAIPGPTVPVIQFYTDQHMDFVALRLRPGEGVQAMQPIRVRYSSPTTTLPLRMVSAGVADKVGVSLYIFAEGRTEAANFPNATVDRASVVWDFATNTSNYASRFAAAIAPSSGRAWVTESAQQSGAYEYNFYSTDTRDDWRLALGSLQRPWVTFLRSDLPLAALDRDLQIQAAVATDALYPNFVATQAVHRPPCSTSDGFYSGTDSGRTGGLSCVAVPRSAGGARWALVLAAAAIAAVRRRRGR